MSSLGHGSVEQARHNGEIVSMICLIKHSKVLNLHVYGITLKLNDLVN